jgi:hypothetical protein
LRREQVAADSTPLSTRLPLLPSVISSIPALAETDGTGSGAAHPSADPALTNTAELRRVWDAVTHCLAGVGAGNPAATSLTATVLLGSWPARARKHDRCLPSDCSRLAWRPQRSFTGRGELQPCTPLSHTDRSAAASRQFPRRGSMDDVLHERLFPPGRVGHVQLRRTTGPCAQSGRRCGWRPDNIVRITHLGLHRKSPTRRWMRDGWRRFYLPYGGWRPATRPGV